MQKSLKKEINKVIGYEPFFLSAGCHAALEPGLW